MENEQRFYPKLITMTRTEVVERLTLTKRMAWRNMQWRLSTEEEQRIYTPILGRIISLVAVLDSAYYDLEAAMSNAGRLRHADKHTMETAKRYIGTLHDTYYKVLHQQDERIARAYNNAYEAMERTITEAILVEEPITRHYSIMRSLCRLIKDCNAKMSRFKLPSMTFVDNAEKALARLPFEDLNLDAIIAASLKNRQITPLN